MVENKMNRHHSFGKMHSQISHALTAMVLAYNWVSIMGIPKHINVKEKSKEKDAQNAAISEYSEELQMIGLATYVATMAACAFSLIIFKLI